MWFGFWDDEHNGGVTRYYQGVYTHYRVADGLASGYVTAFYEDLDHSLLIATTGPTDQTGGIRRVQQGRLSRFPNPHSWLGKGVYAIYRDHAGNLWFGTPESLVVKDQAGKYARYITEKGLPNLDMDSTTKTKGLAGNDVRAILEDRQGVLWIGTTDSGLRSGQAYAISN